jgi:hypothetical protein
MAKVADLTIKHVIAPVITNISTSVTEVVSEDATEKRECILQIVSSETEVIILKERAGNKVTVAASISG